MGRFRIDGHPESQYPDSCAGKRGSQKDAQAGNSSASCNGCCKATNFSQRVVLETMDLRVPKWSGLP
jgi:hypothetical protein